MAIRDDIAAIRARTDLTDEQKRQQIYLLKSSALLGVLQNGQGPVPHFIGRTFTWQGVTITVHAAKLWGNDLFIDCTLTKNGTTRTDQYIFRNPPVLNAVGSEELVSVASEMLASMTAEW